MYVIATGPFECFLEAVDNTYLQYRSNVTSHSLNTFCSMHVYYLESSSLQLKSRPTLGLQQKFL